MNKILNKHFPTLFKKYIGFLNLLLLYENSLILNVNDGVINCGIN